jgi:TPP-dependent indolepyruvate ferredoxin oxidoreductase alpha subunit
MKTETETLRTELIEMVRLSQRTVDYAIKAYGSGRPEYAQHACFGRDRLVRLNKKICCATLAMRNSCQSVNTEMGFGESIRTISGHLFDACQHAYRISFLSVGFVACRLYEPSCSLLTMGAHINSAMRLCAVAIINHEVTHAEGARHGIDYWRSDVARTRLPTGDVKEPNLIDGCPERAIARCMLEMMDDIYMIAIGCAAIVSADNDAPKSWQPCSESAR